jgi:hypothetical protein
MKAPRAIVWAVSLAVGLLLPLLVAPNANAYTWMIRHGYAGCMPCHTDPSGGGPLTAYGRAQGELLMQDRYGEKSEEASPLAGLAWGQIQTSDAVRLGGDFREAFFSLKPDTAPATQRLITMQADLFGDLKLGHFRAAGTIAFAPTGDYAASLTRFQENNIISRDHWLGAEIDEDGSWLLRAGRIALPFGIRNLEHNLFARVLSRTDIDKDQQYGVALSVSKEQYRGEVMGIVGNFQLRPDEFRERGYSGYFEYAPMKTLALGASSLFTRATRDIVYGVTDYRYANGLFVRYAPVPQLVILAEGDSVYQSLTWHGHRGGFAGFVQADVEPTQGVHVMLTGEAMNGGAAGESPSFGGWLSMVWFFWSHVDVRLDNVYQVLGSSAGETGVLSLLLQFHVYL